VIDSMIIGYPESANQADTVTFRISRDELSGARFQYQIGYIAGYDYRTVFDEWQNAAIPRF